MIRENAIMYPYGYSLFPDNIDFEGLKHGLLNSSYLMASLAALCDGDKSPRIQKLFKFSQPNNAGIWVVNFCINGIWTEVIIDDHLPVDENGELVFARNKPIEMQGKEYRHVIWGALLEKAWAKVNGSYDRILCGSADLALIHLTDAPTLSFKNEDSEKEMIWNQLLEAQQKNHSMIAATYTTGKIFKDCGLIANHDYFIQSLY